MLQLSGGRAVWWALLPKAAEAGAGQWFFGGGNQKGGTIGGSRRPGRAEMTRGHAHFRPRYRRIVARNEVTVNLLAHLCSPPEGTPLPAAPLLPLAWLVHEPAQCAGPCRPPCLPPLTRGTQESSPPVLWGAGSDEKGTVQRQGRQWGVVDPIGMFLAIQRRGDFVFVRLRLPARPQAFSCFLIPQYARNANAWLR